MDKSKTIRIYEGINEKIATDFRKIRELPLKLQRYLFFSEMNGRNYHVTEITEDDDKIVVVSKNKRLIMGSYGLFEGEHNKLGITYNKKGRSSARLVIWGGRRIHDVREHIIKMLEHLEQWDALVIYKDTFLHGTVQPTKGMISAMMSGKITTKEECIKYYATYSLKDIKIKQELRTTALLKFFEEIHAPWQAVNILRSALDPNKLLANYLIPGNISRSDFYRSVNPQTIDRIHALDIKLKWETITEKELHTLVNTKYDKLGKIVHLWKAGATGNFKKHENIHIFVDDGGNLPF